MVIYSFLGRMNIKFFILYTLFNFLFYLQPIMAIDKDYLKDKRVLPFSRIKLKKDDVYFTLGMKDKDEKWQKLLSINSYGADAIVKFSKRHYGENICDYNIPCYKYNIIANFDKVYLGLTKHEMPKRVELEYQAIVNDSSSKRKSDSLSNTEVSKLSAEGFDVESTYEKFKRNQETIEVNIKLSKENDLDNSSYDINLDFLAPVILKGVNKLKKTFTKLFSDEEITNPETESITSVYTKETNSSNNDVLGSSLKKELSAVKDELLKIEKEEEKLKNNLTIGKKETKSLIESIWKREILAGVVGAFLVFSIVFLYYMCNGLMKSSKLYNRFN